MICNSCKSEFDDNSRFCPQCGAAKPDGFSSGADNAFSDVPFFVPESEKHTSAQNNRHGRTSQPTRGGYHSQNTQHTQNQNYRHQARSNQNSHFTAAHVRSERTFSDQSIKKFLIGFTIVAVAVVVLVIGLIVASRA
ncbi:MAG: zinc ribbon domain-containing protein [Oscillospiraceae bacterium]|nr:zinc ribbon domain-containing protein [Oscillospiraceae bacterium]